MSTQTKKQNFTTRQSAAEDTARRLIYGWSEHGITTSNDFPDDRFPNITLVQIAGAVREAVDHKVLGWNNILDAAFTDAPPGIREAFIECTEGVFPASPDCCGPLVEKLREFHIEKRTRELLDQAHRANETGDSIENIKRQLLELESEEAKPAGIADQLADRAFDFDKHPEKPIPIFRLCDMPLSTAGNLTNIQALPKAGKSAVMESMIAASMNDNRQGPDSLGFAAENPQGHALIHFDTEQSRYDADALIRRACRRAQVNRPPAWLMSYSVADLGVRDRRHALRHVMGEARDNHGGIFAVMIDGIGDLCADPNDSEEAFDLVHELHALAITYDCTICTVLHENPGSESGKTRGHLGSQLERKAETNLRLAKDKDGITTIWAERARHCYLPKEQGPCFSWNDQAGMHTSCGTSGEIKSAAMREKMEGEADSAFGGEESLSYSALVSAIRDALDVSERTAKSRIKTWLAEGITRKDSTGNHHLANP